MVTTIGSLANVPNAGAPITSPWAQDITRLGVHVFASKAALDAATWPGLADGAEAWVTATGTRYVRVGGIWYRPNQVLGYGSQIVNGTIPTGAGAAFPTMSAQIPAGRILRITGHVNASAATGNIVMYGALNGVNSVRMAQFNAMPGGGAILLGSNLISGVAAGTHTFGIVLIASAAGATHNSDVDPATWWLEDIGP